MQTTGGMPRSERKAFYYWGIRRPENPNILAQILKDILSDIIVFYRLPSSACSKSRQRAVLFAITMITPTTSIWNSRLSFWTSMYRAAVRASFLSFLESTISSGR